MFKMHSKKFVIQNNLTNPLSFLFANLQPNIQNLSHYDELKTYKRLKVLRGNLEYYAERIWSYTEDD